MGSGSRHQWGSRGTKQRCLPVELGENLETGAEESPVDWSSLGFNINLMLLLGHSREALPAKVPNLQNE